MIDYDFPNNEHQQDTSARPSSKDYWLAGCAVQLLKQPFGCSFGEAYDLAQVLYSKYADDGHSPNDAILQELAHTSY